MCTHVSPKNIDNIPEMYEMASSLGVHEFSLWESIPKKPEDLIISDLQRKYILDFYQRINSTKGGPGYLQILILKVACWDAWQDSVGYIYA
jgi:MoaA/NifB/PqqE/SkfB family radical SAM enzyme